MKIKLYEIGHVAVYIKSKNDRKDSVRLVPISAAARVTRSRDV